MFWLLSGVKKLSLLPRSLPFLMCYRRMENKCIWFVRYVASLCLGGDVVGIKKGIPRESMPLGWELSVCHYSICRIKGIHGNLPITKKSLFSGRCIHVTPSLVLKVTLNWIGPSAAQPCSVLIGHRRAPTPFPQIQVSVSSTIH